MDPNATTATQAILSQYSGDESQLTSASPHKYALVKVGTVWGVYSSESKQAVNLTCVRVHQADTAAKESGDLTQYMSGRSTNKKIAAQHLMKLQKAAFVAYSSNFAFLQSNEELFTEACSLLVAAANEKTYTSFDKKDTCPKVDPSPVFWVLEDSEDTTWTLKDLSQCVLLGHNEAQSQTRA